jgi:hypothetical protein
MDGVPMPGDVPESSHLRELGQVRSGSWCTGARAPKTKTVKTQLRARALEKKKWDGRGGEKGKRSNDKKMGVRYCVYTSDKTRECEYVLAKRISEHVKGGSVMVKVVCGDGSAVVAELRKLHTVLASGGGVDPGAVMGPLTLDVGGAGTFTLHRVPRVNPLSIDAIDANWPPLRINDYKAWLLGELKADQKWFSDFCAANEVLRLFAVVEGRQPELNALKRGDPTDPDLNLMTVAQLQGSLEFSPTYVNKLHVVKGAASKLSVRGDADTERRAVLVRGIEMAIRMLEALMAFSSEELMRRGVYPKE